MTSMPAPLIWGVKVSESIANMAHSALNVKVALKPLLVHHFSAFLPSPWLHCYAFSLVRKLSSYCFNCTMMMARVIALEMRLI